MRMKKYHNVKEHISYTNFKLTTSNKYKIIYKKHTKDKKNKRLINNKLYKIIKLKL